MEENDPHRISTVEKLEALFGPVGEASLRKEVDHLHPVYQRMVAASPFALLATAGPGGLDVSPRGDAPGGGGLRAPPPPHAPGFVAVQDERTLLVPERRGNNRIDSLRNIVHDPRVALLFLIPGVGETLRVNGTARISVEPALLERFAVQGAKPKCVLEIAVGTVFFQCARAVLRSNLWQALPEDVLRTVPSAGTVLAALTDAQVGGEAYDQALPARQRATLY
jgi:PPOX class probable FMN-dependent enzyme